MSWTKEDQARLRVLHTKCMTVKEIAKEMQKPQGWIRTALEDMGYKPIESREKPESEFLLNKQKTKIPKRSYTKITPEIEKRVCELREQCFTIYQIADKLHIRSEETVRNVLKRNGYPTERGKYHKQDTAGQTGTKQDKPSKINREFDAAVDQMIAESEAQKEEKEVTLNEVFKGIDEKFGKEKEPASSANDTSSEVRNSPNISTSNDTTETQKSQALSMIEMLSIVDNAVTSVFGSEAEPTYLHADRSAGEYRFVHGGREYAVCFGERLGTELEYGRKK